MNKIWKYIVGAASALVAALIIFRKKKKTAPIEAPENPVTKVVVEQINDDLEQELEKVNSAITGESPAERLANLGNSRGRS